MVIHRDDTVVDELADAFELQHADILFESQSAYQEEPIPSDDEGIEDSNPGRDAPAEESSHTPTIRERAMERAARNTDRPLGSSELLPYQFAKLGMGPDNIEYANQVYRKPPRRGGGFRGLSHNALGKEISPLPARFTIANMARQDAAPSQGSSSSSQKNKSSSVV